MLTIAIKKFYIPVSPLFYVLIIVRIFLIRKNVKIFTTAYGLMKYIAVNYVIIKKVFQCLCKHNNVIVGH